MLKRLLLSFAIFMLLFSMNSSGFSQTKLNYGEFNGKPIFTFANPATSKWYTDDKGFHMSGGGFLNHYLDMNRPWWKAFLYTQLASFLWEVKDGLISYENLFFWGGDGFDYKDHVMVTVGQLGQLLFDHVFFKNKSPVAQKKKRDEEIRRVFCKNLYVQIDK